MDKEIVLTMTQDEYSILGLALSYYEENLRSPSLKERLLDMQANFQEQALAYCQESPDPFPGF